MSPLKQDLICEIIRTSQTNLLKTKRAESGADCGEDDPGVLDWVQRHAAEYRSFFGDRLEEFPASELGALLRKLQENPQSELSRILENCPVYLEKENDQKV